MKKAILAIFALLLLITVASCRDKTKPVQTSASENGVSSAISASGQTESQAPESSSNAAVKESTPAGATASSAGKAENASRTAVSNSAASLAQSSTGQPAAGIENKNENALTSGDAYIAGLW